MSENKNAPVLAIAIEAAEHTLVRRMIAQHELPALESLLASGRWLQLESPAHVGTSSVWPTFITGEEPAVHGVFSEWSWEPARMSPGRVQTYHLQPFWKSLVDAGSSIGIMAVPFMSFVGVKRGFEISESEPYLPPTNGAPADGWLSKQPLRDILTHGRISIDGPEDVKNLERLASDAIEGIRLRGKLAERLLTETRPDFSLIVFTETHEAGHCLWHSADPEHPLYDDEAVRRLRSVKPTIAEIYQEADRAIAGLVKAVGPDATIIVFALHGMSPARGVPTFLTQLMCDRGFAALVDTTNRSLSGHATELIRTVKRLTPAAVKKFYYKSLPRTTVLRLATPTIMPAYDWSRTRAFSLVNEQNGSIRINLRGREAKGIVPVEEYDDTCREVEEWLWTLRTNDGQPLTRQVIRTADTAEAALNCRLPDITAHWHDVAFADPLRVQGSPIVFIPDGRRYLTQHTSEGFCIVKGAGELDVPDVLPTKSLAGLLTSLVRPAQGS